jgi:hypothetical protein
MARYDQSTVTGSSEPLVDEIAACVSEWNSLLYTYIENRQYKSFNTLKDHINYLFQARRQLLDQALSREELVKLRKEIVHRMVMYNLDQHQDMIVRHPEKGYLLDAANASISTIYQMHYKYTTKKLPAPQKESSSSSVLPSEETGANTGPAPKGGKFHHLFFDLKACVAHICQPGEFTELYFSLYSASEKKFLTEQFMVVLNYHGMPKDEALIGRLKTIFIDLASQNINSDIYLVCYIVRLGGMKGPEKDHFGGHGSMIFGNHHDGRMFSYFDTKQVSKHSSFKRPFGCAVLKLNPLNTETDMEYDMPIYTAVVEANYTELHQDIIFGNTKAYAKNQRAEMLRIHLQTFYGVLDDVIKTNVGQLQDIPHTLRLGFPDVVFPDDTRNELYFTLQSADFSMFGRARNLQATISVRDNHTGNVIENAIFTGSGTQPISQWDSMVFYHEQKPHWGETIKVAIPKMEQWERSHIFITLRHVSSTGINSPNTSQVGEKAIAMGFVPLFLPPQHRDFVADGTHTLFMYRFDRGCHNYIDTTPWCCRSTSPSNMQGENKSKSPPMTRKLGHHKTASNHSFISTSSSNLFPSSLDVPSPIPGKLVMLRDTLSVSTFLCSTRFTQNKVLVKLLNWRDIIEDPQGSDELLAVLDQFTFVGEVEVVKFLADILDALFDIMLWPHGEETRNDVNDEVLGAIVWLLGIVQDRRFSNFRPVLDVYIEQRFVEKDHRDDNTTIFECLLRGMSRLCASASDPSKAKRLRSSMKVWDYLFRFIVRSRQNQSAQTDAVFQSELEGLLRAITQLMSADQPSSMIGTQTLALQHFSDILVELHAVFTPQQTMDVAVKFVDTCAHVTGRLVGFKLAMILSIVKGPSLNNASCRLAFSNHVFRWIRVWLNSYMASAKDVIFSRQVEQQQEVVDQQQTRLPRSQWIENLRLSLTILSEVLGKVRRAFGLAASGLSSSVSSPSLGSRPISLATSIGEDESNQEYSPLDLNGITDTALQLVPQLLNAYKELQRLTIQAIQVSNVPETNGGNTGSSGVGSGAGTGNIGSSVSTSTSNTSGMANGIGSVPASPLLSPSVSRPMSRQSFSILRERASSTSGSKPVFNLSDMIQDASSNSKSKTTVVLQALATLPYSPFPSNYPFTPSKGAAQTNQAAMISTGLMDLTVVFMELFYLTPRQQWVHYIETVFEQDGAEETADFLRKVCYTCMGILFGDSLTILDESTVQSDGMLRSEEDMTRETRALPFQWLNLSAIAHQVVLMDILEPIISIFENPAFIPLKISYFEATDDESKLGQSLLLLWRTYFSSVLRVVGSPRLELEKFLPQEQRAVWKIAGNMRGQVGAKLFLKLWNLAGGNRYASREQHRVSSNVDYFSGDINFDDPLRKSMASIEEVDDDDHHIENDEDEGDEDDEEDDEEEEEEIEYNGGSVKEKSIAPNEPNQPSTSTKSTSSSTTTNNPITTIISQVPDSRICLLQQDLSRSILRPACSVMLTHHDRVRVNALTIIVDIMTFELYTYGELRSTQHLIISALDGLVMTDLKGDNIISSKIAPEMTNILENRLSADNRQDLIPNGKKSVESLSILLGLLLQIRSLPADSDEFMDERITATLKLMRYIQVIEREEIYIKYVHQLVQLHLDSRNFIEAALTLRFHADLLAWDPTDKAHEIPELGLSAQSSFARKEGLYLKMITYLDQGSAWEICVQLCKELVHEYEFTLCDYSKLGDMLQRQASFVENIAKKERCFTEYFRVGFYGRGFPVSSRNKQYVYRGLEWEKLSSFVERMQNRHPNAQLLTVKHAAIQEDQLREMEMALDGQYLHITPVVPLPSNNSYLQNPLAPDYIKKYYEFNEVCQFSFSHPVTKEANTVADKQPESDFLNLWTERVEFECEDSFPTIVRRSKIIAMQVRELSPIENALEAMHNKNAELESLNKKYLASGNRANLSPFSMALNGAVDAPVNGGVPLYKKAFLSEQYWDEHPEMHQAIEQLQQSILDQVII